MEYEIQPSPRMRLSKSTWSTGVQGRWTPSITFDTPGDLAVVYTTQFGHFWRIGEIVILSFCLRATGGFTHTTAAGKLLIQGMPFSPAVGIDSTDGLISTMQLGSLSYRNITKANYTGFVPF